MAGVQGQKQGEERDFSYPGLNYKFDCFIKEQVTRISECFSTPKQATETEMAVERGKEWERICSALSRRAWLRRWGAARQSP